MGNNIPDEIKDLIKWWIAEDKNDSPIFIRFFIYYICLDTLIIYFSGKHQDNEKLKWLIESDNLLKIIWCKDIIVHQKDNLNKLIILRAVNDMRPGINSTVTYNNIENFEEGIRFIYQIRCNLFHGQKSTKNSRDLEFIEPASLVLKYWVNQIFSNLTSSRHPPHTPTQLQTVTT